MPWASHSCIAARWAYMYGAAHFSAMAPTPMIAQLAMRAPGSTGARHGGGAAGRPQRASAPSRRRICRTACAACDSLRRASPRSAVRRARARSRAVLYIDMVAEVREYYLVL